MNQQQATEVRKIARKRYNELRRFDDSHPSFSAAEALEYAVNLLGASNLGTYGEEGYAWNPREGIHYLNTGDSYGLTVYAVTNAHSCRFSIGTFGDYVERHPKRFE